jgi:membrane-associated phospholipid phosphatase
MAWSAAAAAVGPLVRWALDSRRRAWAAPALLAVGLYAAIRPLDGPISAALRAVPLKGDARRELDAWQQYGAVGSLLLTAGVVWSLDVARRRRLLDLAAAAGLVSLVCALVKRVAGRVRPAFGEPGTFVGPLGLYPVPAGGDPTSAGTVEAYRMASPWRSPELWSMPSSHTAAAVALGVFLSTLYPPLRWLGVAVPAVVGLARVKFGAHWPTDVVIGAVLGYALAAPAVRNGWGVRALDWVWVRFVDRNATPAWPAIAGTAPAGPAVGAGAPVAPSAGSEEASADLHGREGAPATTGDGVARNGGA